eukprot:4706115-Amphidinium_carterae.1
MLGASVVPFAGFLGACPSVADSTSSLQLPRMVVGIRLVAAIHQAIRPCTDSKAALAHIEYCTVMKSGIEELQVGLALDTVHEEVACHGDPMLSDIGHFYRRS